MGLISGARQLALDFLRERVEVGKTVPRKGAAKPRLTNTVALAALRSRRYFSRYFSFWLFFGSLFILALPDSGVRGSEARPLSTLMIGPLRWSFGPRRGGWSGVRNRWRSSALPSRFPKGRPPGSCAKARTRVTSGLGSCGGSALAVGWEDGCGSGLRGAAGAGKNRSYPAVSLGSREERKVLSQTPGSRRAPAGALRGVRVRVRVCFPWLP